MKYYEFSFQLFSFGLNTDKQFLFVIGEWETADYSGSLFKIEWFNGVWSYDLLSIQTLRRIYLDWKDR